MTEIGQRHVLRVASVWGTTVLDLQLLERGQSFILADRLPDGIDASPVPVRAIANGWEIDARGTRSGILRLRGREEDPVRLGEHGGTVPVVPGDYGLLQYGLFSVFFQYTTPAQQIGARLNLELLTALALFSSGVFHAGGLALIRALHTPPAIPKPLELTSPDELAQRFRVVRPPIEEDVPSTASNQDKGGGSGVKDPGAKDTKPQGGGQKAAGPAGKLGQNGQAKVSQLPGEPKPGQHYGINEVLSSETGQEIKQTLRSIETVSQALGGLNSSNVQLGGGQGLTLKGGGTGGGGNGPGVPFGSGTLQTGWAQGSGGGFGHGGGGPGGRGSGGPGGGGGGGGQGGGNGPGAGGGGGTAPNERTPAAQGGGGTKGGLTPEQIRRVVFAHQGALRACYEIEAQKNPNLKGGVTVAWTIDPGGGVSSANLAGSTIANPRVEGCVVRQVRTWRFPASEAPSSVSWPFVFNVGR